MSDFLAVDFEGIELFAVGVRRQLIGFVPLGIQDISLLKGGEVLALHQLAQGLPGVEVAGHPIAFAKAQNLALGGANGEGRSFRRVELELDAITVSVRIADGQFSLSEGVVNALLERLDIGRVPVRAGQALDRVLSRQLDGLGLAVQGDFHAGSPGGQVLQRAHLFRVQGAVGEGQGLDLLARLGAGLFSAQELLLHASGGAADIDAVFLRVREGDFAVRAHLGLDHIVQQLFAGVGFGSDGDALALQLLVDLRHQFIRVGIGLGFVEIDGQIALCVGAAVGQGQRAVQLADVNFLIQVQRAAGGGADLILPEGGGGAVQRGAAELVGGGGGQLAHPVDAHVAAGPAHGGHQVLVGALGDRLHRLVEEAGGHQVVGGPVGGVL